MYPLILMILFSSWKVSAAYDMSVTMLKHLSEHLLEELREDPHQAKRYSSLTQDISVNTALRDRAKSNYNKATILHNNCLKREQELKAKSEQASKALEEKVRSVTHTSVVEQEDVMSSQIEQLKKKEALSQKRYEAAQKETKNAQEEQKKQWDRYCACFVKMQRSFKEKDQIETDFFFILFANCKDFFPGGANQVYEKFALYWDHNVCLNTKDLLGGLLQGFFGTMEEECRKTACCLGRLSFSASSHASHVLYLRSNIITAAVQSIVYIIFGERKEGRIPLDVLQSMQSAFERLENGKLFAEKETQDPNLLRAVEHGMRQANIFAQVAQETLSEEFLPRRDNAWIPAHVQV